MAIDAKVSFANQLEKALETELTVDSMNKVMKAVMETLDHFEMKEKLELDPDQDDLLDTYLAAISVQGLSQKTVDMYAYTLRRLLKFCGVPVRRVTVYHIRNFIAAEKARGISDGTLKTNRDHFNAFFNWLHRESLIDKNPMVNIGPIKCQKKKKQILSEVEIEKLTGKCIAFDAYLRNRAIVEFLRSTGCRVSEMVGLNRDAVDLQKLECVVLGKGNKERTVYLTPVAGMMLKEYLDERTDNNPALFIGCRGDRLLQNGVRIMLKKLADRAHVEHVHPHKFRRTLATNLNRRGMPVEEVAAILGHEKLDTTMKYVVLNADDIKQAYRRYAS